MILKVLCVIFLIESCDNFRFSWNDIPSIILRGTKCPQKLPFTLCRIGQCVDRKFSCDSETNCDDSNDNEVFCWNVTCQGLEHTCKDSGCSEVKFNCNRTVECFDGSDGDFCNSTSLAPVTVEIRRNCILPKDPDFGQWTISGRQDSLSPGQSVEDGTVLQLDCNKSHILVGAKDILCENGKWSTDIGHCSKPCPPRTSTETLKVTCIHKNKETENCTEAVDGTLAKFKCAPFFEDAELKQSPVHLCQDGKWNQTVPRCRPACGGSDVNRRTYPWQAALYNHDTLYCSGTLISQRIILTAAHCVTDDRGKLYPKDNYTVAVGKLYSSFNDSKDRYAQFSELEAMFVPEVYRASVQNYLGDIAILVARKIFTLSRKTQPVCLQTGDSFRVFPGDYGYVVGWGFTHESSHPSNVLIELKLPLVDTRRCAEDLPEGYEKFLTYDKLCAGYLNKGMSVCKGDSGGGLVFENDGKFYLIGLISLSPVAATVEAGCDSQSYSLYTNVSKYMDYFILPKFAEYGS